jgi:hypothetical protein
MTSYYRLTRVNHESVYEFHGFCTSGAKFSRDNNFTTFCTRFYDKSKHTITSTEISIQPGRKIVLPSNSQSSQKFVPQTFTLSNSSQPSLLNFFGIQLDNSFTELESLLNKSSELTDMTAFVVENFLHMSCTNDNFGTGRSNMDFAARIALFSEFAGEELIEFSEEDAISDKLSHKSANCFQKQEENGVFEYLRFQSLSLHSSTSV